MVSTYMHQKVTSWTRILSCCISASALTLFTIILTGVLDERFPSQKPGYSTFCVGALSFLIFWNIVALITRRLRLVVRFVHPVGDVISFLVLATLGPIGFAHDDRTYWANGMYKQYDYNDWLLLGIIGGSLGITSIILQLFLIIWNFLRPSIRSTTLEDPPSYTEQHVDLEKKEKDIMDWESVSSQTSGHADGKLPTTKK